MKQPELATFDWNLVKNLQALLLERNVTRAAARVGLTQPAMSRALARLREVFDDPLFVRAPEGMAPTPRALELSQRVNELCEEMVRLTDGGVFNPAVARESFTIVSADYSEWLLLPRLMKHLAQIAPGCSVVFRRAVERGQHYLDDPEIDLLIGPRAPSSNSFKSQVLLKESFSTVLAETHPRLGQARRLSATAFEKESHVLVAPGGRPGGIVDDVLRTRGRTRRVAARVPTFLVAPEVVAQTELLATIPTRLAAGLAPKLGLRLFTPPIEVPGFTLRQMWHPRRDRDPAHIFLRETVKSLSDSMKA